MASKEKYNTRNQEDELPIPLQGCCSGFHISLDFYIGHNHDFFSDTNCNSNNADNIEIKRRICYLDGKPWWDQQQWFDSCCWHDADGFGPPKSSTPGERGTDGKTGKRKCHESIQLNFSDCLHRLSKIIDHKGYFEISLYEVQLGYDVDWLYWRLNSCCVLWI